MDGRIKNAFWGYQTTQVERKFPKNANSIRPKIFQQVPSPFFAHHNFRVDISPTIADLGLIADGHTAGLVSRSGDLVWLCLPRFDSDSVFAALLDTKKGGAWSLHPRGTGPGKQRYRARTNVLVTEFRRPGMRVRLTDWMPPRFVPSPPQLDQGAVFRLVEMIEGEGEIECQCAPAPGYGGKARWEWLPGRAGEDNAGIWRCGQGLWLQSPERLQLREGALAGSFRLRAGERCGFAFCWGDRPGRLTPETLLQSLDDSLRCWRKWVSPARYEGPYREEVLRSALVLKALIYEPTGAIVASPTTSLPECLGGPRNWDYRFCWPRDSTFALYGLSLLGFHEEAGRFLRFIADLCRRHPLPLQVCYRVDGAGELPERELPQFAGYGGSRPVRIGNAAAGQSQLDIYGEVLDAAYTYAKWRNGLEDDLWQVLRKLVNYAAAHWREKDESIWEVRGGPRHFVYSKVMCWVALDRGIKLATRFRLPAPVAQWRAGAAELKREVWRRGYRRKAHAFVQSFDNDVLDSSLLLLPLVRFLRPRDPRMRSTIHAIRRRLTQGPMVWRYENPHADGVGGPEGAFAICSFWLMDCLTLLGASGESRRLFEQMLALGSPLGLFSEEMQFEPGQGTARMLGNFPQAFTHMALINTAHNLELYPAGVPEKHRPLTTRRRRKAQA